MAPGHAPADAGSFKIIVTDTTSSAVVENVNYDASIGNPNLASFSGTYPLYSGWIVEHVATTIGHDYTIQLIANDCDAGGHYGYVYLDAFSNQVEAPNAGVTAGSSSGGVVTGGGATAIPDIVTPTGNAVSGLGSATTRRFDGGTLTASDDSGNFTITNNGGVIDAHGAVSTFTGTFTDDGSSHGHLTIADTNGGGVVALTAANSHSGGTTVQAGATLQIQSAAALGTGTLSLIGTPTVAAKLSVIASTTISNAVTVSGDPIIDVAGGTTTTISGSISDDQAGPGDIVKNGDGTLILSGANSYTGGTILNTGTLALSGAGTLGAASGTTTVAGGTLDLGTTTQAQANLNQAAGTVTNGTINVGTYQLTGGTLDTSARVNAATSFDLQAGTVNGVLGGAGALTKSTAGTVTLARANSYTGATSVAAGTLALSGTGSISASSGVDVASGATLDLSAATAPEAIKSLTGAGSVTLGATALGLTNAAGTFSGTIAGTGSLTVAGGTATLTGANTYSGGTGIAAGATLALGAGAASGTIVGNVVDNGTLVVNHTDALTFAGAVTGTGALVKQNANVLTLTGTNTYSGGTTVSGGKLLGNTAAVQGAITNNATVEFAQATAGTYAGAMTGSGALIKSGAGALTLTGTSAIAGATTISGGLVSLQGRLGTSTATVGNTATLGGTGTLAGNLVVASGGTLAPGNSPGTLTVTGNVTLNGGANFVTELDGRVYSAAGGAGSYDRLALTGVASTFNPGGTITPVLRGISGAATNTFAPVYGDKFTVVTAAAIGAGAFSGVNQPTAGMPANARFDVFYNTQNVQLVLTPGSFQALGQADGWLQDGINAAAGLDAVRPAAGARNGVLPSLFNGLYGMGRDQLGLAFEQISGEIHADVLQAEGANIDLLRSTVDSVDMGYGSAAGPKANLWTQIIGRSTVAGQDSVATRYTDSAAGFMTGLNFVQGQDLIGLAGGYLKGKVRNAIGSDANSTYGAFYLHGNKQLTKALSLNGIIGFAFGNTDTTRTLTLATGTTTSSSRSNFTSVDGQLKLRYALATEGKLKPHLFAGVIFNSLSYGAVQEVNAVDQSLALSLPAAKWQTVKSTLGGDVAYSLAEKVEFVVSGAWNHELNKAPTASRLVNLGPASWTVNSVTASGENLNVGANVVLHLSDRVMASIGYQGGFDTNRYSTHRGSFALGFTF
jgi:autotransporter-associated beta strand protein